MSAEEACEYGIIDDIITRQEESNRQCCVAVLRTLRINVTMRPQKFFFPQSHTEMRIFSVRSLPVAWKVLQAHDLSLFRCSPDSSWREALPVLLLGSAWFSLWHLHSPAVFAHGWTSVRFQTFMTFWAGLLFNFICHWTGSIWLVIPLHAAGNFAVSFI
ncbi:hypothetical protein CSB45_10015 [candidate division KSB3 bacterium]|uniref:CAAX prenyl protease 2/Lysostaphin resistance protein A-like domain-containing protein n=1 Tax=candidate division KSB3 bacterium TaxID=2044937 RepID=A0A2G6E474_9BACT|nr:MAG: hypothetical protein CSB45_10015 [candidate division KSB3 bacterium]PIE29349.1 MAG: hypothetical protein CSA57_09080 [candidate division KSB3 bacterium]